MPICTKCQLDKEQNNFKLIGSKYTKKCIECLNKLQKYNDNRNSKRHLNKDEANAKLREKYLLDPEFRERKKEISKTWRDANLDKRSEYQKQYYEDNRQRLLEYQAAWRENNWNQIHAAAKSWRERNKEKLKISHKLWSANNRDKHRSYEHKYRATHKSEIKERNKRRDLLLVNRNWTEQDLVSQIEIQDSCCFYCCEHMDSHTVDHVIPITQNGTNTLKNIVPCCFSCNSSKRAKLLNEIPDFLSIKINEIHAYKNVSKLAQKLSLDLGVKEEVNSNILKFPNLIIYIHSLFWDTSRFITEQNWLQNYKSDIRVVHLFEDQLQYNYPAVLNTLQHQLNLQESIYARNTNFISGVSINNTKEFLSTYHILGDTPNLGIRTGLVKDDELVAVATYSTVGTNTILSEDTVELTRMCFKDSISGGVTKLIHNFFNEFKNINKIVTFVDPSLTDGSSYEKFGWNLINIGKNSYEYVIRNHRERKSRYNHQGMAERLDYYSDNLSERENMESNGFFKVWKMPKLKYELNRTNI